MVGDEVVGVRTLMSVAVCFETAKVQLGVAWLVEDVIIPKSVGGAGKAIGAGLYGDSLVVGASATCLSFGRENAAATKGGGHGGQLQRFNQTTRYII